MAPEDVLSDLKFLTGSNQASGIIEEFIPGPDGGLPTEYKKPLIQPWIDQCCT